MFYTIKVLLVERTHTVSPPWISCLYISAVRIYCSNLFMTLSPVLLNNLFINYKFIFISLHTCPLFVLKASPSTLSQCDRSPRGPFQPGPLHSSPLQTPTVSSPVSSPCSATASPIGRPPSYHNGHHRPPPAPHKSPFHSKNLWFVCEWLSVRKKAGVNNNLPFLPSSGPAQSSPQPPKYPESGGGTIRPVSKTFCGDVNGSRLFLSSF